MAKSDPAHKSPSQSDSPEQAGAQGTKKEGGGYMAALSGVSSNAGLLGLHMVSATAVGLAMGWFLDEWLGTKPWMLLVFLGMGIIEGFRNMWKEARRVNQLEEALRAARERGEPEPEVKRGVPEKLTFFKKEHFQQTYASPLRQPVAAAPGEGARKARQPAQEGADEKAPAPRGPLQPTSEASPQGVGAGEKSDEVHEEVLDEEALRQALIRELESEKGDPMVAEALLSLQRWPGESATSREESSPERPDTMDETKKNA